MQNGLTSGAPKAPEPQVSTESARVEALREALAELSPAERDFIVRLNRSAGPARLTPGIIGLCCLVFLGMVLSGVSPLSPDSQALIKWQGLWTPALIEGEWWRLLSCAFVHVGIIHLGFNMWCLWALGRFAERIYGAESFLAIYLLAALGGSIASAHWRVLGLSVGASGAVFGGGGALLAYSLRLRREIPGALFDGLKKSASAFVGYNLLFGFVIPGIDNAAHLGGLVVGLVAGFSLAKLPDSEPRGRRVLRCIGVSLGIGAVLFGAAMLLPARIEASPYVEFNRYSKALDKLVTREDQVVQSLLKIQESALAAGPGEALALAGFSMPGSGQKIAALISEQGRTLARYQSQAAPKAPRLFAFHKLLLSRAEGLQRALGALAGFIEDQGPKRAAQFLEARAALGLTDQKLMGAAKALRAQAE